MAKTLDLSRTVHDLVADYPELRDVMASIGFPDIANRWHSTPSAA